MREDFMDLVNQMILAKSDLQRIAVCINVSRKMLQSEQPWEYLQLLAQSAMELWIRKGYDEGKQLPMPSDLEEFISMLEQDNIKNEEINSVDIEENDLHVNDDDVRMYLVRYRGIVSGIISLLSSYGYTTEEYYQKLWEALSHLISHENPTANGAILYAFLQDGRTPYCEVASGMRMSNDEYRKVLMKIQPQTDKIRFIFNMENSQKTEVASRILSTMNELKTPKAKTVFLSQVIDYLREKLGH